MINRSTFYQHFTDKYAILERLQERYIGGITERIDAVTKDEAWDLAQINQVFCTYINEHRSKMKKLLSVRSAGLDTPPPRCCRIPRPSHPPDSCTRPAAAKVPKRRR